MLNRFIGLLLLVLLCTAVKCSGQGFIGMDRAYLTRELSKDKDTKTLVKDVTENGVPFVLTELRSSGWSIAYYFADRYHCSEFIIYAPLSEEPELRRMLDRKYESLSNDRWVHHATATEWELVRKPRQKLVSVVVRGYDPD